MNQYENRISIHENRFTVNIHDSPFKKLSSAMNLGQIQSDPRKNIQIYNQKKFNTKSVLCLNNNSNKKISDDKISENIKIKVLEASSFVQMQDDKSLCKICFEGEISEDKLVESCKCSGYMKYVHIECLIKIINNQRFNIENEFPKCGVCLSDYFIEKIYKSKFILSKMLFLFILVSIITFLCIDGIILIIFIIKIISLQLILSVFTPIGILITIFFTYRISKNNSYFQKKTVNKYLITVNNYKGKIECKLSHGMFIFEKYIEIIEGRSH